MFVARAHDHGSCVETALDRAESVCLARGARLTELRRQVLELVWRRHEPIGAYDLLDELKVTHRRAAPPTVYRALEFLIDQGLVHRLESLNAYIGCTRPEVLHAGQFLICTRCGSIGELDDPEIAQAVSRRAAALGFTVERQTIEVRGFCADCSSDPAAAATRTEMSGIAVTAAGARLPVTVLTGFLGSGKTTVLAKLLKHPALARTAVIINELGEVGLDHELVRIGGDGETILLPSGCVCCTLRSDLADTLRELFQKRVRGQVPDFARVILETTGLADPAPILHTLIADPITAARYAADGVVTTIDAYNAEWQLDAQPEAVKQAAFADRILLTKTDLAAPEVTARLIDRLGRINPAAFPIPVPNGAIDPLQILGTGFAGHGAQIEAWLAEAAHRGHDHHDHGLDRHRHDDGIRSFCLSFETPLAWDRVAEALDRLAALAGGKLLRIKGILDIEGSDRPVVVHGVQHLFHPPALLDSWPGPQRQSRIVFITKGLERDAVEQTFRALLGDGTG